MNIYGPYFTDREFNIDDNTHQPHRASMYQLVKFGLNPVRKKFGPTKITSGHRSQEHNMQLKLRGYNASPTSQHCHGEAADFVCTALPPGTTMRHVFEWLRPWWPGQLFLYSKSNFIHIALPRIDLQVKGRLYALVLDK